MRARVRLPVLLAYAAFVLIGIAAGGGGVLLLAQMNDYGVDRAAIGITFFTTSAGFVLGGLSAGTLIQRFGVRIALAVGGGVCALAILYMATRPPFAMFVMVQVVSGFGFGVLEPALNAHLAALPGATTLLNRLHAFFGVGALAGPVFAAWIVGSHSWTVVYLVLGVAFIPLVAGFLVAFPGPRTAEALGSPESPGAPGTPLDTAGAEPDTAGVILGAPGPPLDTAGAAFDTAGPILDAPGAAAGGLLGAALRERGVLLGAVVLTVYVGLEIGVGNWGYSYLVQARGMSASLAGYSVSGYWLGLTLGRFLISPIAERIGTTPVGMIYACLTGITAAATLVWLVPGAAAASVALLLLGFCLGPVFPTMMAMAPQLTRAGLAPTAIGVMNAASTIGGAALPWLAGVITQSAGIWMLLPFTITLAVVLFAVWRPLASQIRGRMPELSGQRAGG